MEMVDSNVEEIISAVAKHDIRWIRKNFYSDKFEKELSINALLTELPEFYTIQDEGKKVNLPKSLVDFFTRHYAGNDKQVEELKEKLIQDFVSDKHILLLHENLNHKCITKIQNALYGTNINAFELDSDPNNILGFLETNSKLNFAILCLTKSDNKVVIISTLMFLIGYFGIENICVIYDNENMEISKIVKN